VSVSSLPWRAFSLKEDWWSVILGLSIVGLAYESFVSGYSLNWPAVAPGPWSAFPELAGQLRHDWPRYLFQFGAMLGLFALAARAMGQQVAGFAVGFLLIYGLSFAVLTFGAWTTAQAYNIDPALIALAAGALIANTVHLPRALHEAFRVEFYIKTGIVLLGATLPLTLLVWAGPVAILQASIVSIATFLAIYPVAVFLELDRKLAVLLAVGGAVCGVAAVIAVAGAIRASREHMSIAVASVVAWSIVLIVAMPLLARAWYLPQGVAGAWIGTAEVTDAAGYVAAHAYGAFARSHSVAGTPDQAIWSYTLLKVVGRDIWIGIWAVILSFVAMTRWDPTEVRRRIGVVDAWRRFPKFILGLLAATLMATLATQRLSYADFETVVRPAFVVPLTNLRTWVFTFSFLSIGLTTRLRGFVPVGGSALIAFATGVLVNLVLGFILSAVVFQSYWSNLSR
jgi:uncharacterized membrane protein YadS